MWRPKRFIELSGTVAALLERPLRVVLEYSMPELMDEPMNRRVLLSIPSCVVSYI